MFDQFRLSSCCFYAILLNKRVFFLLISAFSVAASYAQAGNSKPALAAADHSMHASGFPAGSLVLMPDGKEKKIEDVQAGDLVAAYDPVLEDYILTQVARVRLIQAQKPAIISIMLILDDLSASLQANGSLAGVSLMVTADAQVLTREGPRQAWQLIQDDILYCYDESAHRFLSFRVYNIDTAPDSTPQTIYQLYTEDRNCVINSTVVLQAE